MQLLLLEWCRKLKIAECLPKRFASEPGIVQQISEPRVETVYLDRLQIAPSNPKHECLPCPSVPDSRDVTDMNGTIANGDHPNTGTYISKHGFSIKIDVDLFAQNKALLELQRNVADGQNQSFFCLALALGTGLIGGLFQVWLSSQIFIPPQCFGNRSLFI